MPLPSLALLAHDVYTDRDADRSTRGAGLSVGVDALLRAIDRMRSLGYAFVGLREFLARRRAGGVALLTFDDGYRGVYEHAFERLIDHRVPFLSFLVSDCLPAGAPCFPLWVFSLRDRSASLAPDACSAIEADPGIRRVMAAERRDRFVDLLDAPPERLYTMFYPRLSYPELERIRRIVWESGAAARVTLSAPEIAEMRGSGLVEFGAHSVSHVCLPYVPRREVHRQILESCRAVAALTGQPMAELAFAYPYGLATPLARRLVARHCAAGFTTVPRAVSAYDGVAMLPRRSLDEGGEPLELEGDGRDPHPLAALLGERVELYWTSLLAPLRRWKRRISSHLPSAG